MGLNIFDLIVCAMLLAMCSLVVAAFYFEAAWLLWIAGGILIIFMAG